MLENLYNRWIKIICSVRQDLTWWRRNIKLDLSMIVSVSFSNYLVLQDWNYRTHNTDKNWISTRTKSSTRRIIISEGRRFSEILRSEACTRWENEESSRTASWRLLNTKIERKSWDDTKSHFSVAGNARSDEFHEWFRKLSRSGIESQWEDCLAFPVNLRWSQVLVPCWAATNACNLTHGKRLDYRKTFLVINFVHLIHTEIINNEFIILCHFHRIGSSAYWFKNSCRKRWCKWGHNSNADICKKAVDQKIIFPVDIQQDSMVGQQRQQISELQFHKFFTPFFLLEDTIQKSNDYLFWFSIGGNVMDQRSRECRFIGGTKTSRSIAGKDFQKIEMLDAGIAFVLNKIIQNSHFKKNVSLEEQNAQKEDRFPRGRQSRSWFTTTFVCVWRSGHSTGLRWFILCYSPWWQHSGIRYKMGWSSVVDVKNSTRWCLGKSSQIEDTWVCATWNCFGIVRHGDSSEDIDAQ